MTVPASMVPMACPEVDVVGMIGRIVLGSAGLDHELVQSLLKMPPLTATHNALRKIWPLSSLTT